MLPMTEHVITSRWVAKRQDLAISAAQYRDAQRAKDFLLAGLALEESYDVLVLNFASFEAAIFGANLDSIVSNKRQRADIEQLRRNLDRHLVNLMASGEMCLAHASAFLTSTSRRGFTIDATMVTERKARIEAEFPAFAAMRWLRNATLHEKLPISSWSYGGSWTDPQKGPEAMRQHRFSIALDSTLLTRVRDMPNDLRSTLASRADSVGNISWRALIREYVEGVSLFNSAVREALLPFEQPAQTLLDGLATAYRLKFRDSERLHLDAVARTQSGEWTEYFALDFDHAEQISALRNKNGTLVGLTRVEIVD